MQITVTSQVDEEEQIRNLKLTNLINQYFSVKNLDVRSGGSFIYAYRDGDWYWPFSYYKLLDIEILKSKTRDLMCIKIHEKHKLCSCSLNEFCDKLQKLMVLDDDCYVTITYSNFDSRRFHF